jgi:hypothetical protein
MPRRSPIRAPFGNIFRGTSGRQRHLLLHNFLASPGGQVNCECHP